MKKTLSKSELEKQLAAIIEQEEKDVIEKHYPEFKKLEGRCFKTSNSYGDDYKPWFLYTKIVAIKPTDVYDTRGNGIASRFTGYSFQTTSTGEISVDMKKQSYVHSIGKEITESEFNTAWNKMIDKLDSL
jgi:hypothetical protein